MAVRRDHRAAVIPPPYSDVVSATAGCRRGDGPVVAGVLPRSGGSMRGRIVRSLPAAYLGPHSAHCRRILESFQRCPPRAFVPVARSPPRGLENSGGFPGDADRVGMGASCAACGSRMVRCPPCQPGRGRPPGVADSVVSRELGMSS